MKKTRWTRREALAAYGSWVATQVAADRIYARRLEFVCPSIVMDKAGHPSPYGDMAGDTPERLRSIMIAHQAA